jgi:prepilin-type N-terminal cleavage/methylation domain-containing protein
MSGRREGFTIMEVIVSIVLVAIILTTLAGLTFATARQAVFASDVTTREAASLAALNRLATLPFDQLPGAVGCDTTGTQNNHYEMCVSVSTAGAATRVEVTTTPLQRAGAPTSVQLVRMRPPPENPFNCVPSC